MKARMEETEMKVQAEAVNQGQGEAEVRWSEEHMMSPTNQNSFCFHSDL